MASPVPVLPDVGSMIVPPGLRRPSRSAASTSRMATRSLIEPPGLKYSTLATICGVSPAPMRARRTSGVSPTVSRIESLMSASRVARRGSTAAMPATIRNEVRCVASAVMHRIRLCPADDGVRLAFGVHDSGPPLVKVANWMTHLEHDWASPIWRHWLQALGERWTVVRYDERGCGLSDREVAADDYGLERWVPDLEAVVEAAEVD